MKNVLMSITLTITCFCIYMSAIAQQQKYQPGWKSLSNYKIPAWFRDAKFGIFIHWGIYSVPDYENEWYPRNMYLKDSKEFKHHIAE